MTKAALAAVPPSDSEVTTETGAVAATRPSLTLKYLLRALIKYNASDLHIKVGRSPLYRINGKLIPAKMPELTKEQAESILIATLSDRQRRDLEEKRQVDLSVNLEGLGRFRCNLFYQRGMLSAAIRMIPVAVPAFDKLRLPPVLKELCLRPRGLFLVTGATGSGKSTTMSALIQYINEVKHCHILAIEDPIEFVYRDVKAAITQREVGSDTLSFQSGLISGLRQDPDVIVIGEIRDKDTLQAAITAAETGHLVVSTMHTNDAKSTIDRILDIFPPEAQAQVRVQLAASLVGVLSQRLVPRADGSGRVPACEVLVKSPTIENALVKNEREKIPEIMANSATYYKMQTMNMALEGLVAEGLITLDEAMRNSTNPDDLALRFSGITRGESNGHEEGATRSLLAELPVEDVEIER